MLENTKVSQLIELTAPASGDLLYTVHDPSGTPLPRKMTLQTLFGNISLSSSNTTANVALVEAVLTANVAHANNRVVAGHFTCTKNAAVTGNVQLGIDAVCSLTADANIVSLCAAARVALDPGPTTQTTSNALAVLVVDAAQTGTRETAPSSFIAFGDASPSTQPVQYLLDVGRPAIGNVSGNSSTVNGSLIFSQATSTTITHKLRVRVNGATYYLCLTSAI